MCVIPLGNKGGNSRDGFMCRREGSMIFPVHFSLVIRYLLLVENLLTVFQVGILNVDGLRSACSISRKLILSRYRHTRHIHLRYKQT